MRYYCQVETHQNFCFFVPRLWGESAGLSFRPVRGIFGIDVGVFAVKCFVLLQRGRPFQGRNREFCTCNNSPAICTLELAFACFSASRYKSEHCFLTN